jgi:hypothetical protein
LAQTLSAAGRAAGPFLSGGLFTIATKVKPKGEALAFGVFGGISFIGFLLKQTDGRKTARAINLKTRKTKTNE